MRLLPTSVRARLTLWYSVVLSIPLIGFAAASYLVFSRTLHQRTDAFIHDALTAFAGELGSERRIHPTIEEAVRATVREVRFRDLGIMVLEASRGGALIAASPPPAPTLPAADLLRLGGELDVHTLRLPDGSYRVVLRELPAGEGRVRLAGVYPLREVEATLERTLALFQIVIPLLIVSAATGGWFLAKRSFRPVSTMAARAAEIGATNLHERLPVLADDELGSLARVLNELLDRLDRSFAQQRRFMTDASHELRTPAAILRAEAEITLAREHRSEREYREALGVVQDAARRLTRIVDDIFLQARADAGQLVLRREPLYLEDVVRETVRAARPLAERRGVALDLASAVEGPSEGDPDLLGRVLLNLLDNAIKHTPSGGRIVLTMADAGTHSEVHVVDSGTGIPPDAQERIFEPFYRADPARARAEPPASSGAGLGLALGRRIAELHGGSLDLVRSAPGRTEFRLRLPRRPAALASA